MLYNLFDEKNIVNNIWRFCKIIIGFPIVYNKFKVCKYYSRNDILNTLIEYCN